MDIVVFSFINDGCIVLFMLVCLGVLIDLENEFVLVFVGLFFWCFFCFVVFDLLMG